VAVTAARIGRNGPTAMVECDTTADKSQVMPKLWS
jgi:hypothetical protein